MSQLELISPLVTDTGSGNVYWNKTNVEVLSHRWLFNGLIEKFEFQFWSSTLECPLKKLIVEFFQDRMRTSRGRLSRIRVSGHHTRQGGWFTPDIMLFTDIRFWPVQSNWLHSVILVNQALFSILHTELNLGSFSRFCVIKQCFVYLNKTYFLGRGLSTRDF